jgi:hypothetical protein
MVLALVALQSTLSFDHEVKALSPVLAHDQIKLTLVGQIHAVR